MIFFLAESDSVTLELMPQSPRFFKVPSKFWNSQPFSKIWYKQGLVRKRLCIFPQKVFVTVYVIFLKGFCCRIDFFVLCILKLYSHAIDDIYVP